RAGAATRRPDLLPAHRPAPVPLLFAHSQTSHQAQTTLALHRLLQYYGDLSFTLDDEAVNPIASSVPPSLDPLFELSPTLNMYRDHVLHNVQNTFTITKVEDFVWRRAWGENVVKIAEWIES